jgi:signal transduction histidine kinase
LDQLTDELNHIRHIIRQTLDLYRASAKHVSVPIERLLDTVLAFYDHKVQFKQVAIEKRYTSHSVVQAFSEELRQVFTNLVVNALEALPRRGGRLVIHTFRSRDWNNPERTGIRVVIADNGSGIELQHREKIFQPHFTTKGDKGTGLGLWVSAEFIRKLQGSIRLKTSTQPDRNGTIFSVFLPDNLVAAPV